MFKESGDMMYDGGHIHHTIGVSMTGKVLVSNVINAKI